MKIGIVGLGDMGKMFAKKWSSLGYEVFGNDLPANYDSLKLELENTNITVFKDSKDTVDKADFILIAVEAENIDAVVKQLAPHIKNGAIITGQTSVKTPEIKAFEKYLSPKVHIIGSHALFGPNVNPSGQIMAIFEHKNTPEAFDIGKKVLGDIGAKLAFLDDYKSHDKMMADIQVVTHVGFESIGTAFMHRKVFPWENTKSNNGLDNIKLLLTLRIYSYKAHVYAGLAFHNPYAKHDVRKYANVENELFGLMISEKRDKFISKIKKSRDLVFKDHKNEFMLQDKVMQEYSLNPNQPHRPNSHLSLLSMVCTWADLKTNPYENQVCQTPPFKLRVGLAEYLFLNDDLLEETINTALQDKSIIQDDLAFHTAVHEWTNILELGDKNAYLKHFEATKKFLAPRLEEGRSKSTALINRLNNP